MSQTKVKKSILKRWWFWVVIVIIVARVVGGSEISNYKDKNKSTDVAAVDTQDTKNEEKKADKEEKDKTKDKVKEEAKDKTDKATMGEKNALKKAKDYLAYSAFSKSGLVKQLEYEGFTSKEAEYGVKQCGADWNEQAAKKAKDYLSISSYSKSGLIDQLEYEGFTNEQAKYGVSAVEN